MGDKIPENKLPEQVNSFFASIGAKLMGKFATIENHLKQFTPEMNHTIFDIEQIESFNVIAKLDEMSEFMSSGMTNISSGFMISAN